MNSSLKDYYIKIEQLYNESLKLLLALNKSLTSNSSEVNVQIINNDNTVSNIKIPSFLYMDNKIEQLSTNFNMLFNIPKDGEAWFQESNNTYKLNVVQTNTTPSSPDVNINEIHASIKQNNILKDLVSPQTFLKINIDNIPDNIEKIYMKKFIYYDIDLFEQIQSGTYETYDDYIAAFYNLSKGIDYDEYESVIDMPLRNNKFESEFKILEIIDSYNNEVTNNKIYEVKLDTIQYNNFEDKTVTYSLKIGDYISLEEGFNVFKVIDVKKNNDIFLVTIEETNGHTILQSFNENQLMVFRIYNPDYQKYKYVEIPIEENQYITVFIATINNNIRSKFSEPININLDSIYIYDENDNIIVDNATNTKMTYLSYYNKYCKNIGDILEGLTNTIYPQFSNFTLTELQELQDSDVIKDYVSNALNSDDIKVVRINDHIFNEESSEQIMSLNSQKLSIQSQLNTLQNNIDDIYNQLTTTNFNEDITVTQNSLKEKLTVLYNERNTLNKQLISTVNEIDVLKGGIKSTESSKYRVRGILNTDNIEQYIEENINYKCKIIGIDVEYRYKSINTDTSNVISINANIFSEWNKFNTIDKERKLVFDNTTNTYKIEYVNYDSISNNLSWKQIDIPITSGEDVIIRLRYKYSIGQPFINFYSPWSDEFTIAFPLEFTNENDITTILYQNENDVINAKFINTLISQGYEEHVNNKIIDGEKQYYHMPENIYSGFNTPENKLISLKDKLTEMSTIIDELKTIHNQYTQKYKVYLEWDGKNVELLSDTENEISINIFETYENEIFTSKKVNLIFRNVGDIPVKFYNFFKGTSNTNISDIVNYSNILSPVHYKNVPVLIENEDIINNETLNKFRQKCGQWIYFRQTNPYTLLQFYTLDNSNNIFMIGDDENYKYQGLILPPTNNDQFVNISEYKYLNMDSTININNQESLSKLYYKYENIKNNSNNLTVMPSGAFFTTNLVSSSQLQCDKNDNTDIVYKTIDVGDSVTIPLLLEYYINSNEQSFNMITRKLMFDIRPNVDKDIKHYIISIKIYNNTNKGDNNIEQSNIINNDKI